MNNQKLLVAGVDEAGRGPLIGDMFMAIVVVEEEKLRILEQSGVRDSKKLTREKREKLLPLILSIANFVAVHRITPDQIDKYNINMLELESLVRLVKLALTFHPVKRVFIDAFTNPTTITSALHTIKEDVDVIAEYNADSKYIAVSSASIVAKVLRDWHIDQLKKVYGDIGSGYPSDKRTVEWLQNYYKKFGELPSVVRKSWKTIERILGIPTKKQKSLEEYIEKGKVEE